MSRVISTCLLALAVMQGVIPADNCILKLAGICKCSASVAVKETRSCCHAATANARVPESTPRRNFPLNDDHQKPCCAYTPAHGLTVDAPGVPVIDAFRDCVPTAFVVILDSQNQRDATRSFAPHGHDSPQPHDTPLYLRVHAFLI